MNAETTVLHQFLKELAQSPENWGLRGIVADWYEDNQEVHRAECLRWMIQQRKRPYTRADKQATWFNADRISPGLGDPESDIPEAIFKQLEGGKPAANHITFGNFPEAEEAIQKAWAKARAGGWSPHG
ncbi:MAG: hypothetical protein E6G97_18760 [Alphaproteobacteria bacterium]|nr:MAG: hypothetical protein E6G97_18760 [Alphaproteobacteria bacterium]